MTARDKMKVTSESRLARRSQRAFERWIDPWLFTAVDQRDDYGRDGSVQVVDQALATASPLTFFVQLKSTASPLSEVHPERLETRHIAMWTERRAPPTLVVIWSEADDEIRCRTARDIVDELSLQRAGWRDQDTVTAHFRREHAFPVDHLRELSRRIGDEADREGGIRTFHCDRSKVILTDLLCRGVNTTSSILGLNDGRTMFVGPGWSDGDLDGRDVFAPRVLAGAFLLYEQVWLSYDHMDAVLATLGSDLLIQMLHSKRLVPFVLPQFVGFEIQPNEAQGKLTGFVAGDGPKDPLRNHIREYTAILAPSHATIAEEIFRNTLLLEDVPPLPLIKETLRDLGRPEIRTMLGLSQHRLQKDMERRWDWPLVNRLVHINTARSVANAKGLDVIEYEGGMSRVASEKWFSEVDFHRLYPTSTMFDGALRKHGVPDLGLLVEQIDLPGCFELSGADAAYGFRRWFWATAAELLASGADLTQAFQRELSKALTEDADASRLPSHLKLAYCQEVGADYLVGAPLTRTTAGFSTRSDRGEAVLRQQRRVHSSRRKQMIMEFTGGKKPGRNDPCVCGSGRKFKRCCGI